MEVAKSKMDLQKKNNNNETINNTYINSSYLFYMIIIAAIQGVILFNLLTKYKFV